MRIQLNQKDLKRISRKELDKSPTSNSVTSRYIKSSYFEATKENMMLLEQCRQDWDSLYDFRKRRLRSRKYYQGDQWHELIVGPNGRAISEENHIKSQGKIPFKQNIIRQIVRNMLGQYRTNPSQSIVYAADNSKSAQADIMGAALESALTLNNTVELDAAALEEFILSGAVVQKEMYSYWPNRDKEDLYIENVNVNRMFFNSDVSDIRLNDLSRIGEVKDTTVERVIATFGDTKEKERAIRDIYRVSENTTRISKSLSTQEIDRISFFYPADYDRCRIIEVWYLKYEWRIRVHDTLDGSWQVVNLTQNQIGQINAQRIEQAINNGIPVEKVPLMESYPKYEPIWMVKYLSPMGHCFYEAESPYEHQEHPYAIKLSPMLDGEVRGMVEDIIDQQRYINRLISMLDFIMGASAKGVLLVPEDSIPDDMDINDFASEWTKFNGVIKIKLRNDNPNAIPKQVSANSTNIGAFEMLNLQLKLIMDIGGVGSAIQGQDAKSGTPSSLYAQMAQNSLINSRDLFDKFIDFKNIRDKKALKIIKQFYTEPRMVNFGGKMTNGSTMYTPEIADIDMELRTVQGTDTPVYRAIIDDTLMNMLSNKLIDIKMFLEHTSLPFADKLLDSIQKREQQGGNAQIDPEDAEQLRQAQIGAAAQNPKADAMINQMMARSGQEFKGEAEV